MTPADPRTVAELLASLCDRDAFAGPGAAARPLVRTDAEFRRLYVEYLDLHARLSYQFRQPAEAAIASALPRESEREGNDACGMMNDECPANAPPCIAPSFHPSSFIIHPSVLSGVPFSYAIAALLMGVGIFAAWLWTAPSVRAVVSAAHNSRPIVGTITLTKSCRWLDPRNAVAVGDAVPKGRRFNLAGGLAEIAFDTGTHVMLQGPVTFEVDSPNGGLLLQGRIGALGCGARQRRTIGRRTKIAFRFLRRTSLAGRSAFARPLLP